MLPPQSSQAPTVSTSGCGDALRSPMTITPIPLWNMWLSVTELSWFSAAIVHAHSDEPVAGHRVPFDLS